VAVVQAVIHVRIERHDLFGHHDERPHHALVLVLEDVAVVHVAAGAAGELSRDRHELVAADRDDVLRTPVARITAAIICAR
jgi:hypothetical protein